MNKHLEKRLFKAIKTEGETSVEVYALAALMMDDRFADIFLPDPVKPINYDPVTVDLW